MLVIILLRVIAGIFPWYFETGNDIHAALVTSGVFTGYPDGLISSYGCFILISDLLAMLFRALPGIAWFDWFTLAVLSCIVVNILWIVCSKESGKGWTSFLVPAVLILLLLPNLIMIEATRTAMLLSGTSLLLLVLRGEAMGRPMKFWLYLLIISGLLVRIEAGLLAVAFVSLALLLLRGKRTQLIRYSVFLAPAVIVILLFINFPRNAEESRYLAIRPYQFSLWDYNKLEQDAVLESRADSVRFYTATRMFLGDEEELSPNFFDRIGVKPADKTPRYFLSYFYNYHEKLERLTEYAEYYFSNHVLYILALCVFTALLCTVSVNWRHILLVLIGVVILLSMLALFMKMELRLFYPATTLAILCMYVISARSEGGSPSGTGLLAVLLVLLSLVYVMMQYTDYNKSKAQYEASVVRARSALGNLPLDAVVLVNKQPYIYWYPRLFFRQTGQQDTRLLVPVDNGLLFIQKGFRKFLVRHFGCYNMSCYLPELMNRDHLYFLSDQSRMELMATYFREVHQVEFTYQIKLTFPEPTSNDRTALYLYEVTSVRK